jgi:hypothetical protein
MSTDVMIERVIELAEPSNERRYREHLRRLHPDILRNKLVFLDEDQKRVHKAAVYSPSRMGKGTR